jgi:biopolymer transport protein ExbD
MGARKEGSVKLSVVDISGAGIPGASVTVEDSRGKIVFRTRTDQSGSALITLPEEEYTLFVEKKGYPVRKLRLTVIAGSEIVQTVKLFGRPVKRITAKFGILPVIIRYGEPAGDRLILKVKNPARNSKYGLGELQIGEKIFPMGQLPFQIRNLNEHQRKSSRQSVWLWLEKDVRCSQITPILSLLYDLCPPKQLYLHPASSYNLNISLIPMKAPDTTLFIAVDDCSSETESPPVEGATVEVEGGVSTRRSTDSRGIARFTGIPPGEYTVRVSKEGYEGRSVKVIVDPQEAVSLLFHMVKAERSGPTLRSLLASLHRNKLKLSLPGAAQSAPVVGKHGILFLYRSGEMLIESEGVGWMIGSLKQLRYALSRLRSKRLLIATDGAVTAQRLLSVMKYAADNGFKEFAFVVESTQSMRALNSP